MADDDKTPPAPAAPSGSGNPEAPNVVHSSSKPTESTPPTVVLDHGEPDEATLAERDAAEKVAQDPWGSTPAQMRDQHDPGVDPAIVGTSHDGIGTLNVKAPVTDAMEPEQGPDGAVHGGTNAPA